MKTISSIIFCFFVIFASSCEKPSELPSKQLQDLDIKIRYWEDKVGYYSDLGLGQDRVDAQKNLEKVKKEKQELLALIDKRSISNH